MCGEKIKSIGVSQNQALMVLDICVMVLDQLNIMNMKKYDRRPESTSWEQTYASGLGWPELMQVTAAARGASPLIAAKAVRKVRVP